MEVFEQYSLINQKRWKRFLTSLDIGEYTFTFPSVADIKSCKAIGYDMNSDRIGKFYSFSVDKGEKKVVITVKAN